MSYSGESETINSCIWLNNGSGLPDVLLKRTAVVIKGIVKGILSGFRLLLGQGCLSNRLEIPPLLFSVVAPEATFLLNIPKGTLPGSTATLFLRLLHSVPKDAY